MGPAARLLVAALVAAALGWCQPARGQNDWQYPDPYFGILEIEKSRPAGSAPGAVERSVRPRRPLLRPRQGRRGGFPEARPAAQAGQAVNAPRP
ncbi:MAG: hypothetical protein EBZ74_00895 [Planctomycetia bacterium]|nr:hypothetical protein [Planctomycetia bacterium]